MAIRASKLDETAKGVFVIAATPFLDDGALDVESIGTLVDFYLRAGVTGMTILGMMGEAGKLSDVESRTVVERFLTAVEGRVPVVVGVSNPVPAALVALAREAMSAGAAGVMLTPQPTLKTDEQMEAYFGDIFRSLGPDIPVVLQDYPFVTNAWMSVPLIRRLVAAWPQLVMLKHEDCPGLAKLTRLRRAEAAGTRRIAILTGSGGLYLPQELWRGADGAMTGFAYPEMLVQVCALFAEGEAEKAEDLFDLYLPLLRLEAQPNVGLAIRKEVLARRGAMRSGFVRSPGPRLGEEDRMEITRLIDRLERRVTGASA